MSYLAAHCLLVLLAGMCSPGLFGFDAEARATTGDSPRGTGGLLLALEQLDQEVKLGAVATTQSLRDLAWG